jgi:hypothetical protein
MEEFYPGKYPEEEEGKGHGDEIMKEQAQQGYPIIAREGITHTDSSCRNVIQHAIGEFSGFNPL